MTLENRKASRIVQLWILLFMFLIMLALNILTPMLSDDFLYAFNIANGERLTAELGDIVESVIAHGVGVNGRYFSHFFAQLFLTLPPLLFDVINAAVFVATGYMIYRFCNRQNKCDNLFLLAVFGSFWLFEHHFGQVNLWLDGACNYLFAVFWGLLFLFPFMQMVLDQKRLHPLMLLPHMLLSVLLGGYLEPLSVGFICAAGLLTCVQLFYYKDLHALRFVPSLLCSVFGLALMVFAPAEAGNKLSSFSFLKLLDVFGIGLFVIASCFPIILLYIAVFRRLLKEQVDRRVLITSVILLIGALFSNFIMMLAINYPLRCSIAFVCLLILSTALLWGKLQDRSFGAKSILWHKLCAAALGLAILFAFADNICSFACIKQNERIIAEAIENGERTVVLKTPTPFTKYNGQTGIIYLDDEDPQNWPNPHMAKYYNLDAVIGS